MKCFESPWLELFLYVSGMFFVTFGLGSLIVSIDPHPLDSNSCREFFFVGISFLVLGGILLFLTATVPDQISKTCCFGEGGSRPHASVIDLLEDIQSVGRMDSPIVKWRSDDSVRVVKSCMMMQSPFAGSDGMLFFKETVV